jgi:hypothetical protein
MGSPSLAVVLVSVFVLGVVDTSSAVQEFKDTHTRVNKNSFTKKYYLRFSFQYIC